jgi:hypothetical protein
MPKAEGLALGERVAFDIGYRLLPEGIRVAYWQDDAASHGKVLVSNAEKSQFEEVSRQRSRADTERFVCSNMAFSGDYHAA